MAYRVRYQERGAHVQANIATNKQLKRKYTVKKPQYGGEYTLRNY
ncbi:hypothetical protein [Salipaludibacillus sp. LMS25]|nr:hypothetical protein [Salipaludibacillus sp. LMS25]